MRRRKKKRKEKRTRKYGYLTRKDKITLTLRYFAPLISFLFQCSKSAFMHGTKKIKTAPLLFGLLSFDGISFLSIHIDWFPYCDRVYDGLTTHWRWLLAFCQLPLPPAFCGVFAVQLAVQLAACISGLHCGGCVVHLFSILLSFSSTVSPIAKPTEGLHVQFKLLRPGASVVFVGLVLWLWFVCSGCFVLFCFVLFLVLSLLFFVSFIFCRLLCSHISSVHRVSFSVMHAMARCHLRLKSTPFQIYVHFHTLTRSQTKPQPLKKKPVYLASLAIASGRMRHTERTADFRCICRATETSTDYIRLFSF